MQTGFTRMISAILLAAAATAQGSEAGGCRGEELLSLYQRSAGGVFRAPPEVELSEARKLFAITLTKPAITPELRARWSTIGFDLLPACAGNRALSVLIEQPARREGRGFFAFAAASESPALIQAPHRETDRYTGQLVLDAMRAGTFAAAAWNSLPRRVRGESEPVNSDLAHLPRSYFTVLVEAHAQNFPEALRLQLHGFERRQHPQLADEVDLIASGGPMTLAGVALKVVDRLRARYGQSLRRYPDQLRELGGTTNASGRALAALGASGFLHLETSAEFRARLVKDAAARDQLWECLR